MKISTTALLVVFPLLMSSLPANAQISPDLTLPNNTNIQINENLRTIEGGTQVGNNLFHSFKDFSVPTDTSVHFNNALDVYNIIARVTGGSVSNLDGLISANNTANLFLINPSGIVFGPNARLDIGGSLFATTADSLEFANGSEFSAINPQQPLLTVDIPIGLQFNGNSGSVTVQGKGHTIEQSDFFTPLNPSKLANSLEVKPNNILALIGNNIALNGAILKNTNGRLELVSLEKGVINLSNQNNQWLVSPGNNLVYKDIRISNNSLLYDGSSNGSGNSIEIYGDNIFLDKGSLIIGQSFKDRQSGNIFINAVESLNIQNESQTTATGIFNINFSENTGGNIEFNSGKISLKASQVATTTFSSAAGGNVIVNAEQLNFEGLTLESISQGSGINTFTYNAGKGGDIIANVAQIVANNGGLLTTTFGSGDSGVLRLNSNFISLRAGSSIGSATFGQGKSGSVSVNSNSIEIIGTSTGLGNASNIQSSTYKDGNAGNLEINSSNLLLQDGGTISTSTFASGDAGNLLIRSSEAITISGKYLDTLSAISSSAPVINERLRTGLRLPPEPTGTAGSLTIDTQKLTISNFGQLSVINQGSGDAGTININADKIDITNQGGITATTAVGEGGNINLKAENVQLNNSFISATAGTNGSTGNGGNIGIETGALILQSNSQITANAFEGRGGNIKINTPGLFASPDSQIKATSERGVNGSVQINTTQIDIANSGIRNTVFQSPQPFNTCSPEPPNLPSELTISAKGGLPASLDDLSSTTLGWTDSSVPISSQQLPQSTQTDNTENIVVAQGWRNNGDGTVNFVITPDPSDDMGAYSSPLKSSCIKRVPDVGG